jgi:hypothetical protein
MRTTTDLWSQCYLNPKTNSEPGYARWTMLPFEDTERLQEK